MSRPFNATLRGWLGLLEAKVAGQAPSVFEEAVRPVLSAWPHLYAEGREVIQAAAGGLTSAGEGFQPETGAAGILTVPQDQIWMVEHHTCSMAVDLAATEALILAAAYDGLRSGVGATSIFQVGPKDSFAQNERPCAGNFRPYVALPGDRLGVFVHRVIATVTIDINIAATIVRCKI